MTTPVDHVHEGLKRTGHQYGQSVKFRQFVAATLQPLNDLEAAFLSLLALDIDAANGVTLDLLGRIVGAPAIVADAVPLPLFGFDGQDNAQNFGDGFWRESGESGAATHAFTEADYRKAMTAQIIKNHSECSPNDVMTVAKMWTDKPFKYIDGVMWIGFGFVQGVTVLERCLIETFVPRPAGVGLRFFSNWIGAFGWADQPDSAGFGDSADANIGGFWIEEV